MKLLYCPECRDVFSLNFEWKHCSCKKCYAKYEKDGLHAIYTGIGIPIGFNNLFFRSAIELQPRIGRGKRFEAFVIPKKCENIKYK